MKRLYEIPQPNTRFAKLTTTGKVTADKNGHRMIECICDCGRTAYIKIDRLYRGQTVSCGCRNRQQRGRTHGQHGMSYTPEYRIWAAMKDRCHNPHNKSYYLYGERGINVCESWRNLFDVFFADMGPRPSVECSLDRIDNDGDYCPENCRWATKSEQSRNRRDNQLLTVDGITLTLTAWSERTGIKRATLDSRRRAGWSPERIVSLP